jgi:chemotaxis protein CheX
MSVLAKSTPPLTVAFDANWKNILECAAVEVFEMMASVQLQQRSAPLEEPKGELTAMVGMAGAICGMIAIRCSQATAVKLVSLMLGEEAAPAPPNARDAIGELCNVVAGNFKSKIGSLADHCMLSVPTVISGENYSLNPAEPTHDATIVLWSQGDPLWISLVVHGQVEASAL